MNFTFRPARQEDIEPIMLIICQAQAYFAQQGIPQWQNGYPDNGTIRADIAAKSSYVLQHKAEIVATSALYFGKEPTYAAIYQGSWLSSDAHYATIHRMAVLDAYKGQSTAALLLKYIEELCAGNKAEAIRVDTHQKNMVMQGFLRKNDYIKRGIIYLADGAERVAFEKLL